MGYTNCKEVETDKEATQLSTLDRQGIAYLYNLPRNGAARFSASATATDVQDVLWFTPGSTNLEHWLPVANGGVAIQFTPSTIVLPFLPGDPILGFSTRWRPIPVLTSNASTSDILLHGFGDADDYVIEQLSSIRSIDALPPEPYDVPLVGSFTDAPLEDVWLVSPGSIEDPILRFDAQDVQLKSEFDGSKASENHYIGLTGLFQIDPKFSNLPSSQVLWYRLQSTPTGDFRLLAQDFNQQSFIEVSVNLGCYLIDSQEYIPLQGNFDTDTQMELLWYSPTDNVHVLWHDINGMLSGFALPCEPYASMYSILSVPTENVEAAKPSVGDFNGDGIDDVFWYLPGQTLVSLLGPGEPLEVLHLSLSAPVDATPIVGDFNGDKCEDILWYLPHPSGATGTRGQSPVWRSLCDGNFVEEVSSVSTPGQAYPIGYNPRRGRGI